MSAPDSRPRPWFAALTTLGLTGLGHCYLREWRRAGLWFGLALTAGLLLVPEPALVALVESGTPPGVRALLPVLSIRLLATLDAYRLAGARRRHAVGVHCPRCGKSLDMVLDFCPWCTEEFVTDEEEETEPSFAATSR